MIERKTIKVFCRIIVLIVAIAVATISAWHVFGYRKSSAAEGATERAVDFSHTGATELSHAVTDLQSGSYYMTEDISLSALIEIGSNSTVNFCLHGHTLTANNRQAFEIYRGSTLNLYDCGGDDGTAGKITVKGIRVWGGTFNMYGGVIRDVDSNYGSGGGVVIANSGVFNMYGGSITDNEGSGGGGGVHIGSPGTFNMYGGSIANNYTANYHGGAGVLVSSATSSFHMYGGSITNNTIKTSASVTEEELGLFYQGGGVGVSGGTFSVEGDVNITGNARVTYGTPQSNNVQLGGDCKIDISGPLGENARIGVSAGSSAFTNGYSKNNTQPPSKYFSSDDDNLVIDYDSERKECVAVDPDNVVTYTMESATVTGTTGAAYGATKVTFTLSVTLKGSDGSTDIKTVFYEHNLVAPLERGINGGKFDYNYGGNTVEVEYRIDIPKPRAYIFWTCGGTQLNSNTYKYKYDGNNVKDTVVARYEDENGETVRIRGAESDAVVAEDEYGNPVANTATPRVYKFHIAPDDEYIFDNNLLIVEVVSGDLNGSYRLDNASVISVVGSPTVGDTSFTVRIKRQLKHVEDSNLDKEDLVDHIVRLSDPLTLGAQKVDFVYTYNGVDEVTQKELSVNVTAYPKRVTIKWYYGDVLALSNSATHLYNGADESSKIVAEYDGYDGEKKRVVGTTSAMLKTDANGTAVTSMSEIGEYKLSVADVAEYVFANNEFTYTVVEKLEDITDLTYVEGGTVILGVSYSDGHGFENGTELVVADTECDPNVVDGEIRAAKSVKFVKDSAEIAASGRLTVHVLIPEALRGETIKIYNLKNGVATRLEHRKDGNYAVFETNDLNTILFVVDKDAPPTPVDPDDPDDPNDPNDPDDPSGSNSSDDPSGDDLLWLWILLAIVGVGLIILITMIVLKKIRANANAAAGESEKIMLEKQEEPKQKPSNKCPNCGHEPEAGAMFCNNCGKKLVSRVKKTEEREKKEEPEQKPSNKCPNCGHEPEAGAMFCNNCGKKLVSRVKKTEEREKQEEPKQKPSNKCPNCGHEPEAGAMFCNNCGKKLVSRVKKTEEQEKKEEPKQKPSNKCPNCGHEPEAGAMFCNNCGKKLE